MYNESWEFYDLIYHWKNYENEAFKIKEIINAYDLDNNKKSSTILDVACGTGEHHKYLKKYFKIDGLDLTSEFLKIARGKNPDGNYYHGDMISFDLKRKYDIVMCLFSSIGYVKTYKNLEATLKCFYNHLEDKGIIIIEPWFAPDNFKEGTVHLSTAENENIKVCRMNLSERKGNLSIMKMHYLVGTIKGVEHREELHEMALFTIDEMKKAFISNGFDVEYNPQGIYNNRGVYIGKKK